MDTSIIIDTMLFIFSNLIIIILISRSKLNLSQKIWLFILFITFNSAFNIMVKDIHDYNLLIPRTFIWRFELGPFNFYDLIFVLLLGISLLKIKSFLNIAKNSSILKVVYLRDLAILFLGIFSYFLFEGYWLDGGMTFLRNMKGLLYFNVTLILTLTYLNISFKQYWYIIPISLVLFNGYFALLNYPVYELWTRYGQYVKILSQEAAYTISPFLITYLAVYFLVKKHYSLKDSLLFLLLILVLLQNILSIYKTEFIYFALLFIFLFIIKLKKPKFMLWYLVLCVTSILILFNLNYFYNISFSQSIDTRNGQLGDYINYIEEKSQLMYAVGSGIGSPYKSLNSMDDQGETKKIDIENIGISGYKFEFQIPIIYIFKITGIIGLFIFITLNILFYIIIYQRVFKRWGLHNHLDDQVELIAIGFYILFSFSTGLFMIGGTSPNNIFHGFLVGRLCILMERLKNENIKAHE